MHESATAVNPGLGATSGAWLKETLRSHPALHAAARGVRNLFKRKPTPPKWLPGFAPLAIDENRLAEFDAIRPTLRYELLSEYAELARILDGRISEVTPEYQWWAQHPLDNVLAQAARINLVYTFAKVGGTSLRETLEGHPAIERPSPHLHFMSVKGMAFVETLVARLAAIPALANSWRNSRFLARRLRVLLKVNRALREANRPGVRKPFIVAGVREPLALHTSLLFQSWESYVDSPQRINADFVRARLADDPWHVRANNWLAEELGDMFGVDVYASPFPTERGWQIYENDSARVLLFRTENMATLSEALGAMFGIDPATIKVAKSNIGSEKDYAQQYDAVKKTLRLPAQDLDAIYNLPYARHFYTPAEIEQFKSRWLDRTSLRVAA